MHAVILTFPGHFWQTQLCLQSLQRCYPEIDRLSIIADDAAAGPWQQYVSDLTDQIAQRSDRSLQIIPVTTLHAVRGCEAGWWRQQLIKLTLDTIMPDDRWFVVDGDVIFVSRCDVLDKVPVSRRFDQQANWSKMSVNYVRDVLGISPGFLADDDQRLVTNPIPFRYLDRDLLLSLRRHVERRLDLDFVQAHIMWFQDQTIVADIDPPDRWVMTEWELIECYRHAVLGQRLEFVEIGSGYQVDVDLDQLRDRSNLFLHSYRRDTEIGSDWFAHMGIEIDPAIWHRSHTWYDQVERPLRT